jgi:regulatory protein
MADDRKRRGAEPAPDAASLHEAALNYLARYAATEVGLRRVLERRVERWARMASGSGADRDAVTTQATAAKNLVRDVVSRLVTAAAVNDVTFAQSRSRSLVRAGRSRRAVVAHLAAKGVDSEAARAAVPEDAESELAAALVLARRRRIGPFRQGAGGDPAQRLRELAILARAGFPQDTARRALAMEPDEAEELVIQLRR